jgi:hypothetical protein
VPLLVKNFEPTAEMVEIALTELIVELASKPAARIALEYMFSVSGSDCLNVQVRRFRTEVERRVLIVPIDDRDRADRAKVLLTAYDENELLGLFF